MTSLTCYRIQRGRTGSGANGLGQVVDNGDWKVQTFTQTLTNDFEASLYVVTSTPHAVDWASYVQSGFPNAVVGRASGPSALLLVRLLREFVGSLMTKCSLSHSGQSAAFS